jgi:hypothetical protein
LQTYNAVTFRRHPKTSQKVTPFLGPQRDTENRQKGESGSIVSARSCKDCGYTWTRQQPCPETLHVISTQTQLVASVSHNFVRHIKIIGNANKFQLHVRAGMDPLIEHYSATRRTMQLWGTPFISQRLQLTAMSLVPRGPKKRATLSDTICVM